MKKIHTTTVSTIALTHLRARRRAMRVRQIDIAVRLGIKQSSWNKLENGNVKITLDTLTTVAHTLDVSLAQLMTEVENTAAYLAATGWVIVPGELEEAAVDDLMKFHRSTTNVNFTQYLMGSIPSTVLTASSAAIANGAEPIIRTENSSA